MGLDACRKSSENPASQSAIRFYTELGSFDVQNCRTFDNGEMALVGRSGTSAAIMLLDREGNALWHHLLESNGESIYRDVIKHPNGTYIAVGNTNSSDIGTSGEGQDGIIVAYQNRNAAPKISRILSPNTVDLRSLTLLSDGDMVVVGEIHVASYRSLILRITPDLDVKWGNYFSIGPWHSFALEVLETTPGECVIMGYRSFSNLSAEVNKFSTYFMRLNTLTGSSLGQKAYLDHTREFQLFGGIRARIRLAKTKDGFCWATTEEQSGYTITTHWVRTDLLGEVLSEKRITGLGNASVEWMQLLTDGNYLILGASDDSGITSGATAFRFARFMLMKVDQDGNEIWSSYQGDSKQLQFALCAYEKGNTFNVVGMMQQISSGLRHPCFFQVDDKGRILDEKLF